MARRGRPPKTEAAEEQQINAEVNMGDVRVIVRDMYNCTQLDRTGADYGGHEYAYKFGYLTARIYALMEELHMSWR